MDKVQVFRTELQNIQSDDVRRFVAACLNEAPDYFFFLPASSTGKYHPGFALGEGGLVRHTKAAVRIAADLMALKCGGVVFSDETKDEILAALILHDTVKKEHPEDRYASAKHPVFAAKMILNVQERTGFDYWRACRISEMVARHMGEWTKDWKSKKQILNEPVTAAEQFVHMCDFLASRKYIEVKTDESV